jgi:pimeloyl-ACP methyl ester carboxylesterase
MADHPKKYTTGFVISKDGTRIHYRQLGSGDGLVLVHGAVMYAENFMRLAGLLADTFTVYIPDRAGRSLSAMHHEHSLQAEAEDVLALLEKTGATNIFGLSSGAVITLQAALLSPDLKKVALFEPPIPADHQQFSKLEIAYKKALAKQDFGKAFIAIIKGTGDASLLRALPAFVTAPLMNSAIQAQLKRGIKPDGASLKSLIEAMQFDMTVVSQSVGIIEKSKDINAGILLLGGERSRRFLKNVLDKLAAALPLAKRVTLPGVGHIAADNSGKPELVAGVLKAFFGGTDPQQAD